MQCEILILSHRSLSRYQSVGQENEQESYMTKNGFLSRRRLGCLRAAEAAEKEVKTDNDRVSHRKAPYWDAALLMR